MKNLFTILKENGLYNPACKHLYPKGFKQYNLPAWPCQTFIPTAEGAASWNELIGAMVDFGFQYDLPTYRDAKGNINIDTAAAKQLHHSSYAINALVDGRGNPHRYIGYAVSKFGNFRFILTSSRSQDGKRQTPITGFQAYSAVKARCDAIGLDITQYMVEDGYQYKKLIKPAMVDVVSFAESDDNGNDEYGEENSYIAHHIDFHSAYGGALCETHPEFRPVYEPIYESRHENPDNKLILTNSIGFMQSESCWSPNGHGYALCALAMEALNHHHDKLEELSKRLEDNNRVVLAHNTDGIWYMGEVYHGEGEGSKMGQWETDHIDCKIRFKSPHAYEYIENGKYKVVRSGLCNYDKIKPNRDEWEWGDLFRTDSKKTLGFMLNSDGTLSEKEIEE